MSERIKQLAEQSTRNVESANSYRSTVFDKEMFAELIVRECVNMVDAMVHHKESPSTYADKLLTILND